MTDNDNITLTQLLIQLKRLDYNGWCNVTDGSLDSYSLAEQIEIVSDAIHFIRNN